jgi:type IV pilus assembly protein PilW
VEKGGGQGKLEGEKEKMRSGWIFKERGVTLIELLVTLIICSIVVAGIYRVFIAQSKAYTVQDQIVEIQQTVRGAMDTLLRDLRMTGYYDDSPNSTVSITNPIVYPVQDSSITVSYAYYNSGTASYQTYTVAYWRDAPSSTLYRQLTIDSVAQPAEILLENVDTFNLTYGVDAAGDGVMDDLNANGTIDDGDWVSAANVAARNVVAVRVTLTGRPEKVDANDDRFKNVTPRSLVTAVTLRNLSFRK